MCFAAPGRPVQWARLLKRVFAIDVEICPRCRGQLKVIAAIEDPRVMPKALRGAGSWQDTHALGVVTATATTGAGPL